MFFLHCKSAGAVNAMWNCWWPADTGMLHVTGTWRISRVTPQWYDEGFSLSRSLPSEAKGNFDFC